jgi:hypothetical protein
LQLNYLGPNVQRENALLLPVFKGTYRRYRCHYA